MNDCVSRKAVLDIVMGHREDNPLSLVAEIGLLPFVAPGTPKGRWVHPEVNGRIDERSFECCNCRTIVLDKYRFCPYCGSDMREDNE